MAIADTTIDTSLAIATPGDWFDIRLPQGEAGADELAAQLTRSWLGEAIPAEDLRRLIRTLVAAAAALDILCAYATVLKGPGQLLPASLVVNIFPLRGRSLEQIAADLSDAEGALAAPVSRLLDLPAGRAVRVERLREWGGSADGRHPVSLVIQYAVQIPGSGNAVVLTFSTPALGLAEQVRPMFHAIARTLRLEGQEPGR
jgi:hypothetical protein